MKNDEEQSGWILAVIGILPVIWFALLTAPFVSGGLMEIIERVSEAMNHPFSIQLCGDSVKTVLICLLSYGMGIGIFLSTRKHYRRGEEHGSAKWGNVKKINQRYSEKRFYANKLMTMHVRISYNMRKHLRNAHQQAEKEKKRFAEKGEHTFRQKVCKICGKPFWPSNGQEVLCSEECKTINRRQKQLAYYHRKQSEQKAGEAI